MMRPESAMKNISAGPNWSAKRASGGVNRMRTMTPIRPPNIEEKIE
jgi:hypothetical protein